MSKKPPGSADPNQETENGGAGVSRRSFLKGLSAGGIGSTLMPYGVAAAGAGVAAASLAEATQGNGELLGPGRVPVTLRVNGTAIGAEVEPRETLLDVLRQNRDTSGDYVGLTGSKRVCDRASCGACSMLVDGKLVYGCTYLAIEAQGREVTTVEGLGAPGALHAVQEAFVDYDALMCGFCTPGMVVAVAALLDGNPDPTRQEIQQALDGNICRCGTYPKIFEATEAAAARMRGD